MPCWSKADGLATVVRNAKDGHGVGLPFPLGNCNYLKSIRI